MSAWYRSRMVYRFPQYTRTRFSVRVTVSLSLVLGVAVIRQVWAPIGDPQFSFILFYPVVVFSAWLGGFTLGSLATFASVAALAYFFHTHTDVVSHNSRVILIAMALEGVAISFLLDRLLRRVEREYDRRTTLMQTFINEAPAAIAMFDRDMRYLAVSQRWLSDYHLEGTQVVGRSHYEVFPELPERWKQVHQRCLAGAVERDDDDFFVRGDGTKQWLAWEVRPWMAGAHGDQLAGLLMFSENITQMKEAREQESILQAKADVEGVLRLEAERLSKAKDEFVATLSHELRTPLNAMLGWTQLLRRVRNDPQRLAQALSAIERSGELLAQLISDILDINRISTGKLRLNLEDVAVESLIETAFDTALPQAEASGVALEKEIVTPGLVLRGDPVRLQQCLWNLLSNAIKFTPAGGRTVISACEEEGAVRISVRDTGQGIRPELLPRIFERFLQAGTSGVRSQAGLGLGLAIVQNLVEMHGGAVCAESPGVGCGATFTIILPRRGTIGATPPVVGPKSAEARAPDWSGFALLVVDDEWDAREFLRGALESCGAQVHTASSAASGLTIASRCAIDLIVSDIAMPQRDGCDMIHDIRAAGITTPAIALSAYTGAAQVNRALEAGFTRCLAKPVKIEELLATIHELLVPSQHARQASNDASGY